MASPSSQHCLFYVAALFVAVAVAASSSSSSFLSYDALRAGKSTGWSRSLLQAKKDCPVNMEAQNYTILTSKCKGPNYPPSVCCGALLEFCCGFVDELNDMSNNCADTMFSYINLYGQYPPGLFANNCKGGKQGLSCDNADSDKDKHSTNNSSPSASLHSLPLLLLSLSSLLLSFLL